MIIMPHSKNFHGESKSTCSQLHNAGDPLMPLYRGKDISKCSFGADGSSQQIHGLQKESQMILVNICILTSPDTASKKKKNKSRYKIFNTQALLSELVLH